jgi:hypothetical protein
MSTKVLCPSGLQAPPTPWSLPQTPSLRWPSTTNAMDAALNSIPPLPPLQTGDESLCHLWARLQDGRRVERHIWIFGSIIVLARPKISDSTSVDPKEFHAKRTDLNDDKMSHGNTKALTEYLRKSLDHTVLQNQRWSYNYKQSAIGEIHYQSSNSKGLSIPTFLNAQRVLASGNYRCLHSSHMLASLLLSLKSNVKIIYY